MEDGGSFAKDLGALGRPLERTVLVREKLVASLASLRAEIQRNTV